MDPLFVEILKCQICRKKLPYAPKPILNFTSSAKMMIVGQAPGTKAPSSVIPNSDLVERDTHTSPPNISRCVAPASGVVAACVLHGNTWSDHLCCVVAGRLTPS